MLPKNILILVGNGYTLDNTLKLNGCFNIAYRKYCNRLQLLSKLRHYVTTDAAAKIFQSMILPVVTYSYYGNH